MLLKQLLKNLDYTLVQGCLNTEVTDIYYDSRKVTPGWPSSTTCPPRCWPLCRM